MADRPQKDDVYDFEGELRSTLAEIRKSKVIDEGTKEKICERPGTSSRVSSTHFSSHSLASTNEGLSGLRATSEMSRFVQHGKMVELAEYERALGREFPFPAMERPRSTCVLRKCCGAGRMFRELI